MQVQFFWKILHAALQQMFSNIMVKSDFFFLSSEMPIGVNADEMDFN